MKKIKILNGALIASLALTCAIETKAASISINPFEPVGCSKTSKENCHIISTKQDGAYYTVASEYFTVTTDDGENLWASCVDPGVNSPKGTVVEGKLSDKHQAIFDYACEIASEMDDERAVLLMKTVSAKSGFVNYNTSGELGYNSKMVFQGLLSGTHKWNSDKYGEFSSFGDLTEVATKIVNNAATKTSGSVKFTSKDNGLILTTNVAGILKANTTDGYEITVSGTNFTGSLDLEPETYTINVKKTSCVTADTGTVEFYFEYDESNVASGGYTARLFGSTAYSVQRVIACDKNGTGDSNCDADGNCVAEGKVTVSCDPNTCEDDPNPIVEKIPGESNAEGLCDANGETIVHIYETPGDMYASGDEIVCLTQNEDDYLATDTILGDNPFCKIYCTQDYTLELPGPDVRGSALELTDLDENMFINAGTYFTITEDGNMFSENQVTCYGTTDTEAYENALLALRLKVANAYNEYAKAKGYVDGTKTDSVENVTDPETGEVIETIYRCSFDYEYNRINTSGDTFIDDPQWSHQSKNMKCSEISFDEYTAADVNELKTKYIETINDAESQLEDITSQLNECVNWNFEAFKEIIDDEECETEIEFEYYDNLINPTIEGESTFESESYETSSIKEKTMTTGASISYSGSDIDVSFKCDENGCSASDLNSTSKVKDIEDYKGGTITVKTDYVFVGDEFCVNYTTGEIVTGEACEDDTHSDKITGFPVSLDTPQGRYYYQYTYSGIGYDFGKDASACVGKFDSELVNADSIQCYYDVNSCYDCNVECEGPGCELDIPHCVGDGCKVACVGGGCILDINSGFLATFRTISLNDEEFAKVALLSASPNSLLAYNSSTNFGESNWDNEKGDLASSEISSKGENIYSEEPEYSITLTPSVINQIKEYNGETEENGGYLNDTLTCKDISGKDYGLCISSFIHEKFEQSFEINKGYNSETGEIEEKEIYYTPYNSSRAFQGPAWK